MCLVAALHALAVRDIELADETLYLSRGLGIPDAGLPGFGWGPLYSDIYFAWSRWVPDPITLALLGPATASVIFAATIWLAVRLHGDAAWAFVAGVVSSTMPIAYLSAGVGRVAGGIAVLAIAVVLRWQTPVAWGCAVAMLWLAAGFRPEYSYLAAALTLFTVVVAGWAAARGRALGHVPRSWVMSLLVLAGAIGGLVLLHGQPFADSRLWSAFAQHFAWQHADDGYGGVETAARAMADYFPGADSVTEALKINPGAVLDFVATNARNGVPYLAALMVAGGFKELPALPGLFIGTAVLCAVAATFVLGRAEVRRDVRRLTDGSSLRKHAIPAIFTSAVVLAMLAPVLIVYPEAQYLAGLAGLLIFVSTLFVARFSRGTAVGAVTQLVVLSCWVLFALTCVAGAAYRIGNPPPVVASMRALAGYSQPIVVLSGDGTASLRAYVPDLVAVDASAGAGASGFPARVEETGVSAVVVSPALGSHPWALLSGYRAFVDDPGAFGFHPASPGSSIWLRGG